MGILRYAEELLQGRAEKRARIAIPRTWREQNQRESTPLEKGYEVMDNVQATFDHVDRIYPFTKAQKEFIQLVICTLAPTIFKEAFYAHEAAIRKRYGWKDKLRKGIFVQAPRRFGKSVFYKIVLCVLLVTCPRITLVLVANSQLAAGTDMGMFGKVRDGLCEWFGLKKRDFVTNRESTGSLKYEPEPGDVRELHCYSATQGDR